MQALELPPAVAAQQPFPSVTPEHFGAALQARAWTSAALSFAS
jgi:hypothetical protein